MSLHDGEGRPALLMDRDVDLWFAQNALPNEPAVRRWLGKVASDFDADDIVQEVYAKLARHRAEIVNVRAYMFAAARSTVIDQLQKRQVVNIVTVADLETLPVADDKSSSEQELIGREELALLQAAIADLPEQCRKVLTLRKLNGLSQRDVAATLGLSESTIEKHVAAGIRRCADWFARHFAEDNQGSAPARYKRRGVR
jgi:RNA polymerase sigma-70 factor (ECF subfamily)